MIQSAPVITIAQYGGTSGPVDNSVEAAMEAVYDFKPFIFFDSGSNFGSLNATVFRQKTLDGGIYGQSLGTNYGDSNFAISGTFTYREENRLRMLAQLWDEFTVSCQRGVFKGYIQSITGQGELAITFAVLEELSDPRYYTWYDTARAYTVPIGYYAPTEPPYDSDPSWTK